MKTPRWLAQWRSAARIAAREAASSAGRFAFVVIAVALGVGALTGVRSFSQSFRTTLLRQARTMIAGDIVLPLSTEPLTATQQQALAGLERDHVRWTRITESVSMVSGAVGSAPILTTLKAVDPHAYPYAGVVGTTPAGILPRLDDSTVLASPDLLLRTGQAVGGTLSVAGQKFRILGQLDSEPDRIEFGFSLGPRLLMTPGGLQRTGIVQFGSQIRSRLVFQLGAGAPALPAVEARLRGAWPHTRLQDAHSINPNLSRGLDHATTFLTFISLIVLIVGALGVASAMHAHLQLRLDSIATMKVLGARNAQILRIYGLQTLALGAAGGVLGVGLGAVIERGFPLLLARYFPALPPLGWSISTFWGPAGEGLAAGVLVTLLLTLPTLQRLRHIPPALILRRDVEAAPAHRRRRGAAIGTGAVLLAGLATLAVLLTDEPWRTALRVGGYFLLGLAVAVAVLALACWLLLKLLRALTAWRGPRLPVALRHGCANLYRPGSSALTVLVALGIGVMFTLSVFLLQRALLADLERGTPPGEANVFLIDVPAPQEAAVLTLLQRAPGIESAPELLHTSPVQLPYERRTFDLSSFASPPSAISVIAGRWWSADSGTLAVAVSESLADARHLSLGDKLDWTSAGAQFSAPVTAIFRAAPQRLLARVALIVPPGPLAAGAVRINGGVRAAPAAIPALERALYQHFPTVTVVNLADVIERVQAVVNEIALVVHFLTFFALLAGAIILASSVAGTRFRRMREIAVLKTFGATRGRIIRILSTEFLLLGFVAGGAGAGLALAFTRLLTHRLLPVPFSFSSAWGPALIAVLISALLAVGAGWLASVRIVGLKPLDVLRADR
jgi:putative ABC transport system permease protein